MRLYALVLSSVLLVRSLLTHRTPRPKPPQGPPTIAEAEQFIKNAEAQLNELTVRQARASWVQSNFITDDTEILAAQADEALIGATTDLAKQTTRYDNLKMPGDLARKMLLLKLSAAVPAPAPSDPKELAEMARIGASLEADYGKGKYCPKSGKHAGTCLDITPDRKDHGQQHRSGRDQGPLGRLAQHRSAHARALRTLGRAGQQGRARR